MTKFDRVIFCTSGFSVAHLLFETEKTAAIAQGFILLFLSFVGLVQNFCIEDTK